ncbi:hypothetical protein [Streptomyces endophyticus]|uniref:Secreted protein n=1 Tax=Streptomyces endophyticus TaxID=714166 RepID=A0ABU6FJ39_9ACTN|nr:hypothetical protein [Streptomyces endophyticus]MEB8343849.1 hypothetical protein [Streptomyces endophyticus]
MSTATSAAAPGHRVPGLVRALVVLFALLFAPLAAVPAGASAPPPAAASSSCEPGEGTRDTSEEALRLPTGHPVRLLTTPPQYAPPRPLVAARPDTTTHPAPPSRRALRTVVLRC